MIKCKYGNRVAVMDGGKWTSPDPELAAMLNVIAERGAEPQHGDPDWSLVIQAQEEYPELRVVSADPVNYDPSVVY